METARAVVKEVDWICIGTIAAAKMTDLTSEFTLIRFIAKHILAGKNYLKISRILLFCNRPFNLYNAISFNKSFWLCN
ncbi:hypothetical protein, partial [Oenococcus oeni]|uniref:hypothetical protein n=2 Tax=Oenococcus oeni TaxID=1247 RepID=UPI001C5B6895